jgi:hypothetical protein
MYVLALAASLPWLLASATPRELVYSYTVESTRTDKGDSAHGVDKMDPGGGGTFYFHNVNQHYRSPDMGPGAQRRSGKIVVEAVRQQQDGGLVVRVTEDASPAGPVTCVTFGDTTVVCDPNRQVAAEIPALLALLGTGFVDPSRLDNSRHWHVDAASTSADYTILSNAGAVLDIDESATRTQAGSTTKTTIAAAIEYDLARSLPTSLQESTIERDHRGSVNETISTETTLKLESAPNS